MWNSEKSITLSKICVIAFMVALLAGVVAAPFLIGEIVFILREARLLRLFLVTMYCGAVPAMALLVCLLMLLNNVSRETVFVRNNVSLLHTISWCCFIGTAIAAASYFYYKPWIIVAAAAGFMGLIVRVVKNVFARAVQLQDDADLTV